MSGKHLRKEVQERLIIRCQATSNAKIGLNRHSLENSVLLKNLKADKYLSMS